MIPLSRICVEGARAAAPRGPRVAVAMEARYAAQLQPAGLVAALARAGRCPALLDPEGAPDLHGVDVLVARGRSPAILELLGRAEAAGVLTVNRRAAVAAVIDKAAMARVLAAGGVPIPFTLVGTPAALARTAGDEHFPLVVKPVRGDNGRGLRVVRTRDELAALCWSEPVALAQPLVPSDGHDLKLYVAGTKVWAVRKPSPLFPAPGPAARVPLAPALEGLARRCGRLFGLELYGVDCLETPRGPVVIEVNDFPNYTGVPEADERIACHVVGRAVAARAARAP